MSKYINFHSINKPLQINTVYIINDHVKGY